MNLKQAAKFRRLVNGVRSVAGKFLDEARRARVNEHPGSDMGATLDSLVDVLHAAARLYDFAESLVGFIEVDALPDAAEGDH